MSSSKIVELAYGRFEYHNNPAFDESVEYGSSFPLSYKDPIEKRVKYISYIKLDAAKILPTGVMYEIRTKLPPSPLEVEYEPVTNWGIAWYYLEGVTDQGELFELPVDQPLYNYEKGYGLLGRFKTPEVKL